NVPVTYAGEFHVYFKTPRGFINFLYDQLREFTKCFEDYLRENIHLDISSQARYKLVFDTTKAEPQGEILNVLSFNYTDTCSKLYERKQGYRYGYQVKMVYVHGQVCNSKECNLVLGTHSFTNQRTSNNLNPIPVDFNVFKKHNQRHRYGTIEAYQDFLKILTDPKRIIKPVFHVVGHSLDKTDHNILKHAFLANKNAVINIYYHNEEVQERLINNITDIIGEEEVMAKVRMIYQHDEKRGILKPKK
ncbi:MAG: bacteriophage abortive infection AbiH family protein, partial [Muribaculaceae bacterium]|nr:bacteriophage abortive infection AbiH family protein [Muribaculaceae bacterium]